MATDRQLYHWRQSRQSRTRAKKLADAIDPIERHLAGSAADKVEQLQQAWPDWLDGEIARQSRPVKIDGTTLVVSVTTPAAGFTIGTMLAREILDRARAQIGVKVTELKCILIDG